MEHPNKYRRFKPVLPRGTWRVKVPFWRSKEYHQLLEKLQARDEVILPHPHVVFKAYRLVPFEKVRVVILGKGPYIEEGLSNGLALSVRNGARHPIALQYFLTELEEDTGITFPRKDGGDLSRWAQYNGILLLNTMLTVTKDRVCRSNRASNHNKLGWGWLIFRTIRALSEESTHNIVFILLGTDAQAFEPAIDKRYHAVIKASMPGVFSGRGNGKRTKFRGSRIFSRAAAALKTTPRELFGKERNT